MQLIAIGGKRKMRKAILIERQTIVVPIIGKDGKHEARKWLWEHLKRNDLFIDKIEHFDEYIRAEVRSSQPKEIIF